MQIDCQLEQTATTDSFYQTSSEFQIAPGKPFYYIKGKFVSDKYDFEYNPVQEGQIFYKNSHVTPLLMKFVDVQ